jgi:ACR3 family arsenite transporter
VKFLLGITDLIIPYEVLITSVVTFVVIPLVAGYLTNRWLLKTRGEAWFKGIFLPLLRPVSITALLITLVLLFAFQGEQIIRQPSNILLIAIPLTIQTYFIFFLSWSSGRWLKLPYRVCAPASMIGASNFFELSVAVVIALFGLNSGASLATVVGVLIEVPVMLSLVKIAIRWKY